ncbi:MAG: hypothetical protein DMF56_07960 [Acidobacteria bacterium]|nr:MAG: hypothetical protein DMF56_07960 [Acidobacteriota bacterium]
MRRLVLVAIFIAIALASIGPIRNYDLFWHLATGRWIVEHRALPLHDPFTTASDRTPWINGEWLFEVVSYGLERAAGITGLTWIRALFIAALFAAIYVFAERDLLLTALAWAGAMATLDLRPSSVAALFVAIAIALARSNKVLLYAVLIVVWINVHPSAILAPAIAFLLTKESGRPGRLPVGGQDARIPSRRWPITVASAVALLVNPYGIYGVLAPLKLTLFATGGEFVNAEWLPSSPLVFPLLYVTVIVAAVAFAYKHEDVGKILLTILFAYLAIRHVRNQPLWFAAFPMLVSLPKIRPAIAYASSAVLALFVAFTTDHHLGVSDRRFPLHAVARLKAAAFKGHIYNPDQFGGFLIWSFYPERRALTDGRNELYRAFIPEYAAARGDQRAWLALLRKYRIDLAVDEYRAPLDVISGRERSKMPASLAYWPRRDWALVAYDRAAMVFSRRAAFSANEIAKWEIRGVVPDAGTAGSVGWPSLGHESRP